MGRKKGTRKWDPDEIEFDLNKLSKYMRKLKPGQYANVEEMVAKCAINDPVLDDLRRFVNMIGPRKYLVFDDLLVTYSDDGFLIQNISDEGEKET